MKKINKLISVLGIGSALLLSGCSANTTQTLGQNNQKQQTTQVSVGGLSDKQYQDLANGNYNASQDIVSVNNNKSTLNPKAWNNEHVVYQDLDNQNRTSKANTAFLSKKNLANTASRTRQFVQPTGWHSNRPGQEIYNRGHLIAYSLSGGINSDGKYTGGQVGDQNNPKNLFTQTAYANQKLQTIYEGKVRQALEQNKKVIYQATPIFRGNELMARGINLQAISTDGTLNFNVFIPNKQPGYTFDFNTGKATKTGATVTSRNNKTSNYTKNNYNNYKSNSKYGKYYNKYSQYKKRANKDYDTFKGMAEQGIGTIREYIGK